MKFIFEFLTQEHNINNFEIALFIFAGALFQFGFIYYLLGSLSALGSIIYRDYNRSKLQQQNDINKNQH